MSPTKTNKQPKKKTMKWHRITHVSAKLVKMLLVAAPLLALPFIKLAEREFSDIEIGDVVSGMGPPTSIGGDSVPGLSPEFCDVLFRLGVEMCALDMFVFESRPHLWCKQT